MRLVHRRYNNGKVAPPPPTQSTTVCERELRIVVNNEHLVHLNTYTSHTARDAVTSSLTHTQVHDNSVCTRYLYMISSS